MGKVYPELDERLRKFIASQPMFFVATAPSLAPTGTAPTGTAPTGTAPQDQAADADGGHVNVSPKGYPDNFAVLGPRTVAYVDLTGSGAETIAHVRQNGKITIMFCSFGSAPKVLRLYGTGRIVLPGHEEFADLAARFPANGLGSYPASRRAIIVVTVERIADSCGYAVPVMELKQQRDTLDRVDRRKTADQLDAYRAEKNALSIDGLPALDC